MVMTDSHRFPLHTGRAYSNVGADACQLQDKKDLGPPQNQGKSKIQEPQPDLQHSLQFLPRILNL